MAAPRFQRNRKNLPFRQKAPAINDAEIATAVYADNVITLTFGLPIAGSAEGMTGKAVDMAGSVIGFQILDNEDGTFSSELLAPAAVSVFWVENAGAWKTGSGGSISPRPWEF